MKLRTIIAWVLFVVGLAVVLYGLGSALLEFVGMYSNAADNPLADLPGGGEKGVSDRMMRGVVIGFCGVPPMLVGSVMMGMGVLGRVMKMVDKRADKK